MKIKYKKEHCTKVTKHPILHQQGIQKKNAKPTAKTVIEIQ